MPGEGDTWDPHPRAFRRERASRRSSAPRPPWTRCRSASAYLLLAAATSSLRRAARSAADRSLERQAAAAPDLHHGVVACRPSTTLAPSSPRHSDLGAPAHRTHTRGHPVPGGPSPPESPDHRLPFHPTVPAPGRHTPRAARRHGFPIGRRRAQPSRPHSISIAVDRDHIVDLSPRPRDSRKCSLPLPVVRARLDHAIARRDLAAVRSAARDLPTVVTLADAVQVLLLMLETDDPAFEPAAVRWIARLTSECRGVTLSEVHAALEALDELPAPDAHATLTGLLKPHGLR
jgi:hypothetical protein